MKQLAALKGLALALVAVAAMAGCRRTRHSTNFASDDDIFTTDEVPGSSVQDGNVADDQREWLNSDGVSDPILVDDDSPENAVTTGRFFVFRTCTCDDLEGAIIFWGKDLDGVAGETRFQVRVRN